MANFTETINRRSTRSVKWDRLKEVYGVEDGSDILPMWVADMDFAAPEPVIRAMKERLDHPVFGYSYICDGCKKAVADWMLDRYGWKVEYDWMQFEHGVVPAIAAFVETFSDKGDNILITSPVYPPFFTVPALQERNVIQNLLLETDGVYSVDFDSFAQAIDENEIKLFILCNPHNPGGIAWSREDLRKIAKICATKDVIVFADEIHADLMLEGKKHIPMAVASEGTGVKLVTSVAPTKTFNLAGVQAALMITEDPDLRKRLEHNAMAHGHSNLNAFAAAALTAAYEEGGPWLEELIAVIEDNMKLVIDTIPAAVPGVKVRMPDATYLLWIDYRGTGLSEEEVMDRLLNKGKLALEPGTKYSEAGRGFLRMNVAAPKSTVQEGVDRFIRAFQD
ncbi:MalY/PatB family protein [Bhargavaea ullalensis]|uniref:cysteine-S-conjugate beta-lyase n=1 Tax=Bhargavaea ullalensis TaxID=1265685 RepID=A0ABV2GFB4_9BACL